MKDMHFSVFEYGCLCSEPEGLESGFTLIPTRAFDYLEQLCLGGHDDEATKLLRLKSRNGLKVLQVQNYVGVICTPTGEQIEILPKVTKKSLDVQQGIEDSRDLLLMMLKRLGQFRHVMSSTATVQCKQMPLLEVFVSQFLSSVNHLVKRGLRSDYITVESNLAYQKGKLLTSKQIRHNTVNKHKFYVEYEDFLQNRPANRLIRSALKAVSNMTRTAANQRLLRELDFVFNEVPYSQNHSLDFSRVRLDRSMSHYQSPLAWAKLILEQLSPMSMKGSAQAMSLLFPMEAVFESYVASVLSEHLPDTLELSTQVSSRYLVRHNDKEQFQLKPDLLITEAGVTQLVLDTKWKLIDLAAHNFGLAQSDFYQMFAYANYYFPHESGDLVLIYPAHDEFTRPIEHSFDFVGCESSDDKFRLWVVPFELDLEGKCKLLWPESLSCTFNKATL